MLEELKNLNYRGGKDGLLFFLQKAVGTTQKSESDLHIICSHGYEGRFFSSDELIQYCLAFHWINNRDGYYSVSPVLNSFLDFPNELNCCLIRLSVDCLFENMVFTPSMFRYDAVFASYYLNTEMLPLSFSSIRNVLVSQGFFNVLRSNQNARFYIDSRFEPLIAKHCKEKHRQMSLKQLEDKLKRNKEAGERAELFVLEYEKKRLGIPLNSKIKRISEIDVTAGYDIVSFQTTTSITPDCFIEVKAVSDDYVFFWSKNEFEIAKLKGDSYYLYLVQLSHIGDANYTPTIIRNPAKQIMNSNSWFTEPQSYYIKKVN